MLKRILRQHQIRWIGEVRETLGQTLWLAVPVNFAMIAATFYYTTLRHILPWFDFPKFIIALIIGMVLAFAIMYKFVIPSLYAFIGRQIFEEKNKVLKELGEIRGELDKLIKDKEN